MQAANRVPRHPSPGHAANWICALLLSIAGVTARDARAEIVYKCTSEDGGIAYQATACSNGFAQREIAIAAPPPPGKAPDYGLKPRRDNPPRASGRAGRATRDKPPAESFECRAGNAEVFYQHGPCPAAIAAEGVAARGGKRKSGGGSSLIPVSQRPMPRAEACKRIHAASASDRNGHARDEDVSTYDRNLGRDPCR